MLLKWLRPTVVGGETTNVDIASSPLVYHIQISTEKGFEHLLENNYTTSSTQLSHLSVIPTFKETNPNRRLEKTISTISSLWQTPVYARVRIYNKQAFDGGAWSAPTDPWTVASNCRAEDQYLNNTSEDPLDFRCEDCDVCAVCDVTSTARKPVTKEGCWRLIPSHPDLVAYPFYTCPGDGTCTGGSGVQHRCAEGYHDSPGFNLETGKYENGGGPLCTTCAENYVKRGTVCVFCANATATHEKTSDEMWGLVIGLMVLFFLVFFAFYYKHFRSESQTEKMGISDDQKHRRMSTITMVSDDAKTTKRSNGTKYAVYIAVDLYSWFENLDGCVKDANYARTKLENQHKYNTLGTLFNSQATRSNIFKLFQKIGEKLKANDQLIIFMAGNGSERGFLCCDSRESSSKENIIQYSELLKTVVEGNNIQATHVLFVLDSCFSSEAVIDRNVITIPCLEKNQIRFPALHVLGSCAKKDNAVKIIDSKGGKRGAFTKFFLDAIDTDAKAKDGLTAFHPTHDKVSASSVFSKIYEKINLESDRQKIQQRPQYGSIIKTSECLKPVKGSKNENKMSCSGQFTFYRENIEEAKDQKKANTSEITSSSSSKDYLYLLQSIHNELGSFRYHTLMDILIASEEHHELGDTGLPFRSVVCNILKINSENFISENSVLFEKINHQGTIWLKFSKEFLAWREKKKKSILYDAAEKESLLPNEQDGHSILHAYCETNQSYSQRALLHHRNAREEYNNALVQATDSETTAGGGSSGRGGIGTLGSKVRLLSSFAQCVFFLPIVFDVPWPPSLLKLITYLQIVTTDILLPLMSISCDLRSDYFSNFWMKMMVIPSGIAVAFLAERTAHLVVGHRWKHQTSDLFWLTVDFVIYMSYAQVCSSLFMYFRCKSVQGQRYLVADMRVLCGSGAWSYNESAAVIFILLYMFGIPLAQFFVLCCNRHYLHHKNNNIERHKRVQRRFGSLYQEYTDTCWWVRPVEGLQRLALTGGVVLFGDYPVSKLLGGILVSIIWLFFLIYLKPYRASLDNTFAIVLNVELVLTLVVGMALNLYKSMNKISGQVQDSFQRDSIGFILVLSNATIIILGIVLIFLSFPFISRNMGKYVAWQPLLLLLCVLCVLFRG